MALIDGKKFKLIIQRYCCEDKVFGDVRRCILNNYCLNDNIQTGRCLLMIRNNSGHRFSLQKRYRCFDLRFTFCGIPEDSAPGQNAFIIGNDMLEAVVALPDQLFYNTGISTYIWIVTDRKVKERKGKVQLINATGNDKDDKGNPFYIKMLHSLGSKRKEIGDGKDGKPDQISAITTIYGDFAENAYCKIFDNADFAYQRITIERPLSTEPVCDGGGN